MKTKDTPKDSAIPCEQLPSHEDQRQDTTTQTLGWQSLIDIALVAIIYILSLIVGVRLIMLIIITYWNHLLRIIDFNAD